MKSKNKSVIENNCGICFDKFENPVQDSNDSYPLRIEPGFTNIFGGKILNDAACHKCNDNFVIPFRLGTKINPRETAIYVMKNEKLINEEIAFLRILFTNTLNNIDRLEIKNKINELKMLKEKY